MRTGDLKGKLVAVLGYGMEGGAITSYLLRHGIKPVLFDEKPWLDWAADDKQKIRDLGLNFIFGPDCFKELNGFDVVFRSPGIPLLKIKDSGLKMLTSQTKWFFEHCPAKIIGVTGTKGKGTTSALIYHMLKADRNKLKAKIYLTGNIGKEQPLDFLDQLTEDDFIIYELSSFQLADLSQSPHVGVVLMITSEHLDYHKNIKEYQQAKSAIVKYQKAEGFAVINHDFPGSMAVGAFGKGAKIYFSRNKTLNLGCYIENERIVINGLLAKKTPVIKISELLLRGSHNLENACAAAVSAQICGCSIATIKKVLKQFKGLEHRLELVAEKKGIKFYNDSFSTTPETAMAAIASFSEPEIVILGGSSKNSDFKLLGKALASAKNVKAVILIGREAGKIKDALTFNKGFKGKILHGANTMAEIFSQIKLLAVKGDVVLLSPACASFDMFKNYEDRGMQFKNFVKSF